MTTPQDVSPNLIPIHEAPDYNSFLYLLHGWTAIDVDNQYCLIDTRGRGKGGISHYIICAYTVNEKGGKELAGGRIGSKIAAWDDEEAIEIANRRLAKRGRVK